MNQDRVQKLTAALAQRFVAHVETEEIAPGRFKFEVFSKHFGQVSHLVRQDQAWEVVDQVLNRDDSEDITVIMMYGPEDVSAELVEIMP